jgi:hypothetical protein
LQHGSRQFSANGRPGFADRRSDGPGWHPRHDGRQLDHDHRRQLDDNYWRFVQRDDRRQLDDHDRWLDDDDWRLQQRR